LSPFALTSETHPALLFKGNNERIDATVMERSNMDLNKENIQTQDETGEPAAIDQVEERVEAEMKILKGEAKELVADGLQDDRLAREGEKLKKEGERELKEAKKST
jgi:hypothetical protein